MARERRGEDGIRLLGRLEAIARERGTSGAHDRAVEPVAVRRAVLLEKLVRARLGGSATRCARALARLHDLALFHAAYPDDARVHAAAEAVLAGFARRVTRPIARALPGTGIIGTTTTYGFDYPIARWLAEKAGDNAAMAWDELEDEGPLLRLLPFLAGPAEDAGIDDPDVGVREYVDAARGADSRGADSRGADSRGAKTDLAWLAGRLDALPRTARERDHLYDGLGIVLEWKHRDTMYSRTGARLAGSPIGFHPDPLRRRVALETEVFRAIAGRLLAADEAGAAIDAARAALAAREREMFPISHASVDDVWLYDLGDGLRIAVYGTRPERRLLLESLWGYLILKNGIPIGYGCFSTLFGSSEVALNIFEAFRAGESAVTYAALLRVIHAHSGATSFSALKYQIGGDENEEAIAAGAFWFYHKLGFRPLDRGALQLLEREESRIASRPGYRSPASVLRKFAEHNVYLCLGPKTRDLLGHVPYGRLGLAVTRRLAATGLGREAAVEAACRSTELALGGRIARTDELARELGILAHLIKGLKGWSGSEKRALLRILSLKSGASEREFCLAMNAHDRFKKAILTIIASEAP